MLNLLKEIPIKRKLSITFDQYVDQRCILREGLIVSYDKEILKSKLFSEFKKNISYVEDVPIYKTEKNYKFGTPNTLTFLIKNLSDFDENKFLKILDAFGYFLVKNEKYDDEKKIYQIEPKYPIKIDKKEFHGFRVFHVTDIKNLEKIKKNGLVAKESDTLFKHPNNRIYFFATNDPEKYLPRLKEIISKGKNAQNDFIVFEIQIDDLPMDDIYLDESFQQNFGSYFAFFVLDAIYPSQLKLTDF